MHPLQHALKDLERAYQNFFQKRAAFPRFKRKGQGDGFRYPDAKQFEIDQPNSRIKLPKLGWVRYRKSREILGTPKNITLSLKNGKWFASIQTEREAETPIPEATTAIGIDVGIARFATMSGSLKEYLGPVSKHYAIEVVPKNDLNPHIHHENRPYYLVTPHTHITFLNDDVDTVWHPKWWRIIQKHLNTPAGHLAFNPDWSRRTAFRNHNTK